MPSNGVCASSYVCVWFGLLIAGTAHWCTLFNPFIWISIICMPFVVPLFAICFHPSFLPSFHPYLECLTRAQPLTLYFSSSSSSFSAYKFLVSDYNDVVSHIRFAIHFIFWNFLIHLIFRFWLGVMLCTAPQYSWHDGRGERNSSTSRDSSIKFCREKIPFSCGTRWRRRNQKVKHRQCSRAHSCMGLHARA